jgi:hypothetical protein
MKRFVFLSALSLSLFIAQAQQKNNVNGYGSFQSNYTRINSSNGLSFVVGGGVIINENLSVCLAVDNTVFDVEVVESSETMLHTGVGLSIEQQLLKAGVFSAGLNLFGGVGLLHQTSDCFSDYQQVGKGHLVLKPGASFSFGITRFMKIQLRGDYRIANIKTTGKFDNLNLDGWSAGIGVVFGTF